MKYPGRCTYDGVQDPYGDSKPENMTDGCDRRYALQEATSVYNVECRHALVLCESDPSAASRWSRYLGSASNFATVVGEQLQVSTGHELTYYHAKAAATLLMVQLAVELANETLVPNLAPGGWGMSASELRNLKLMRPALYSVDQDTFFGSLNIVPSIKGQVEGGGTHSYPPASSFTS